MAYHTNKVRLSFCKPASCLTSRKSRMGDLGGLPLPKVLKNVSNHMFLA
jgi:hypothetical protein